jgi:hypothetical protein
MLPGVVERALGSESFNATNRNGIIQIGCFAVRRHCPWHHEAPHNDPQLRATREAAMAAFAKSSRAGMMRSFTIYAQIEHCIRPKMRVAPSVDRGN